MKRYIIVNSVNDLLFVCLELEIICESVNCTVWHKGQMFACKTLVYETIVFSTTINF